MKGRVWAGCALVVLAFIQPVRAILITGAPLSEAFAIGTANAATLPADWRVDRVASSSSAFRLPLTYTSAQLATNRAGGTSMSSGSIHDIYNFGATADSTDRAVGWLSTSSGTNYGNLYVKLTSGPSTHLPGLRVSYDVEKYRNSSNNPFRIEMYYSATGATGSWTSAGTDFRINFSAEGNSNGFTNAPGEVRSVFQKILNVSIGPSSDFFLAWNYAPVSGTSQTNAHALGIDNVTIEFFPEPGALLVVAIGCALLALRRRRRALTCLQLPAA